MSTNSTTPAHPASVADFAYELPEELIAQAPLAERSASRLMVVGSSHGGEQLQHLQVSDLPSLLQTGDRLVVNDTRVVPARMFGRKLSQLDGSAGGRVEFMLERFLSDGQALARLRASKSPKPGARLIFEAQDDPDKAIEMVVTRREGELFVLESTPAAVLAEFLDAHGQVPLPPYITRSPTNEDVERYQTVYARHPGAVAAPTAGLHVDGALLAQLSKCGIELSRITLHVGAGTFQPVRVESTDDHVMHSERVVVSPETVAEINATRVSGGRIVALGTTTVRALEAAAADGTLRPFDGETRLFLTPGVQFNVVDLLLTNFHLPESTLLMLVSAFAGTERVLAAYNEAVQQRYRFFSYGDAMLLSRSDRQPVRHD